ncbi:hypothetical protein [Microbacterium sp. NPDC055357]
MTLQPTIQVHRRRDQLDRVDDRRLLIATTSGRWHRVTAGAYVSTSEWLALKPHQQHLVRVREVSRRMRKPAVLSHAAAAAILGIDLLGDWPTLVDVRTDRTSGGRTHGAIRRHGLGLADVEIEQWEGGHWITTATQTALDLARSLTFTKAVAAVDQALWARREGGPLTTKEELLAQFEKATPTRGDHKVRRVLEAATDLADNVRETESRVIIAQLGFPTPRLQERRELASGRIVFGDFYFPEHDHWGELDGRGKYMSPEFSGDRDASEIVIDEKDRENEIRREVRGFSRWQPSDITPRRLYDILTGDGLPSRLPRP